MLSSVSPSGVALDGWLPAENEPYVHGRIRTKTTTCSSSLAQKRVGKAGITTLFFNEQLICL